jgi:hypothetical protein
MNVCEATLSGDVRTGWLGGNNRALPVGAPARLSTGDPTPTVSDPAVTG